MSREASKHMRVAAVLLGAVAIAVVSLVAVRDHDASRRDRARPAVPEIRAGSLTREQLTHNPPSLPARSCALSEDGASVAYVDALGAHVRDAADVRARVIAAPENGLRPAAIEWLGTDAWLVLETGSHHPRAVRISRDGTREIVAEHASAIAASPDGSTIAYVGRAGIVIREPRGADRVLYARSEGEALHGLSFSPDGSLLAFGARRGSVRRHGRGGGGTVRIVRVDGARPAWEIWSDPGYRIEDAPAVFVSDRHIVVTVWRTPPRGDATAVPYLLSLDARRQRLFRTPEPWHACRSSRCFVLDASRDGRHVLVETWNVEHDVAIAAYGEEGLGPFVPLATDVDGEARLSTSSWTRDGRDVLTSDRVMSSATRPEPDERLYWRALSDERAQLFAFAGGRNGGLDGGIEREIGAPRDDRRISEAPPGIGGIDRPHRWRLQCNPVVGCRISEAAERRLVFRTVAGDEDLSVPLDASLRSYSWRISSRGRVGVLSNGLSGPRLELYRLDGYAEGLAVGTVTLPTWICDPRSFDWIDESSVLLACRGERRRDGWQLVHWNFERIDHEIVFESEHALLEPVRSPDGSRVAVTRARSSGDCWRLTAR